MDAAGENFEASPGFAVFDFVFFAKNVKALFYFCEKAALSGGLLELKVITNLYIA